MKRLALLVVVFPIALLAAWVGRLSWLQHSGTVVHLAVSGFDPRDLLAGHYLTYTVNYGRDDVCPRGYTSDSSPPACLCLAETKASNTHEATSVGSCTELPQDCSLFIKGQCHFGQFEAQIERFYFPESFQSQLAVVPERSAITVVVRPSGDAMVTGFTVDGVDVFGGH